EKDIETRADDVPHLSGELMCAIGGGEIRHELVGPSTGSANFRDHGLRFRCAPVVVHEHLSAGRCQRQRAGPANAAGPSGHECGFPCEICHGSVPRWGCVSRCGGAARRRSSPTAPMIAQPAVLPPSAVRTCPVMKEAFSEDMKTIARATSS